MSKQAQNAVAIAVVMVLTILALYGAYQLALEIGCECR